MIPESKNKANKTCKMWTKSQNLEIYFLMRWMFIFWLVPLFTSSPSLPQVFLPRTFYPTVKFWMATQIPRFHWEVWGKRTHGGWRFAWVAPGYLPSWSSSFPISAWAIPAASIPGLPSSLSCIQPSGFYLWMTDLTIFSRGWQSSLSNLPSPLPPSIHDTLFIYCIQTPELLPSRPGSWTPHYTLICLPLSLTPISPSSLSTERSMYFLVLLLCWAGCLSCERCLGNSRKLNEKGKEEHRSFFQNCHKMFQYGVERDRESSHLSNIKVYRSQKWLVHACVAF